ncbi:glucose dehydrogenase [FAD, quinone]-like [Vanessa tameamea]|uniref:Glucose dehydrogenase [FAD, quinone]-like n=1 Tax=Vanessa tameamea TaxID=334116 RepID=A0A8B8IL03_VANTA
METVWRPADISSICPEQQAPLTQCSGTGFMFLTLVTQLFGGVSYSVPELKENPYQRYLHPQSHPSFPESSIGSTYDYPLQAYKSNFNFETFHPISSYQGKSYQSKSYNPYSQPSYNGFKNDYSKFKSKLPIFDFDFLKNSFDDLITAGAMPAQVETKSKMESIRTKRERRSREKRQPEEYDFIIIGAGSAGCVLANRLSEVKKWKVLLIEAGPEEPDVTMVPAFPSVLGRSSIDWNYRTQPEKLTCRSIRDQTCAWTRGKTMGGSSAVNYLVYMRGNKRDYDNWAELGNHGWSYREVLPYFKKSENNRDIESHDKYYHSVGGPLNVERFSYVDVNTIMLVEAFKEKGLPIRDLTREDNIGTDIGLSTSKDGRRVSTNIAFIKPIRNVRPNLHIEVNAFVTKIIIDPHTKTAHGVNYIKDGIEHNVYAKKEVILSSGAINSPKILMLSGIGPKHHLESLNIPVLSDLNVGQNLQDHVTTEALTISLSNKTSTLVSEHELLNEVYKYQQQHPKKHGPLATTSTLNGIAFIRTKYEYENVPDIQFHFDARNVEEFYSDPTTYIATNILPLSFYNGLAARPLLLVPKSRGFILLNHTDPIFGPPLIYPRFFTVKEDLDVLVEGLRYAVSLEDTDAFKHSGASFVKIPVQSCTDYIWGTYDYFACLLIEYTGTIYHPVGTCKMGPEWDTDAVVDPKLRVYGIKKLRVIDSSIMPVIIRGNTNAPTIMIAEKASDIIKREWLS